MTEGRERFIRQLENAAKRVDIMTRDEISSLFRRAALRLRNMADPPAKPDHEYQTLIDEMNGDRSDGAA